MSLYHIEVEWDDDKIGHAEIDGAHYLWPLGEPIPDAATRPWPEGWVQAGAMTDDVDWRTASAPPPPGPRGKRRRRG